VGGGGGGADHIIFYSLFAGARAVFFFLHA